MKKTTKAFMFLGGASIVIAGLGLAACSSTTTTVVDNGDASGGMDGKAGGDGAGSDGGTGSDTGMNDAMAQGDCKVATLHAPKTDAGPFCPFVGGVAPGANCNVGEYCCKPGISPGRCVAAGAGGANPCMAMETAFQCDDDVNCNGPNGGGTCCGTGTIKQDATCVGTRPTLDRAST